MKGQAPIDPNAKFPPLPPTGVDSKTWVPGQEISSSTSGTTEEWISGELQPQPVETEAVAEEQWIDTSSAEWTAPADDRSMNWAPPADNGSWSGDTWTATDGSAQSG
jgi:hypothetical protein